MEHAISVLKFLLELHNPGCSEEKKQARTRLDANYEEKIVDMPADVTKTEREQAIVSECEELLFL